MRSAPTLFDDVAPGVASPPAPATRGTSTTRRRERSEVRAPRPRPIPLSTADHHPEAEARFDLLFTREQMAALNAACSAFYEQWGMRINKSQIIRALLKCLREARPALDDLLGAQPPPRGFRPPPKAAPTAAHRDFETALGCLLLRAIQSRSTRG